jgi:hypothetical protein
MKILPIAAPIILLAGFSVLNSQTPPGTQFRIVRLDPALDEIISPDDFA